MYDEHEKPKLAAELAALERQLANLAPTVPRIDRDRLMYDAGFAARRPRRLAYIAEPSWFGERFWQSTTAIATAASVILAAMLFSQQTNSRLTETTPSHNSAIAEYGGSHDSPVAPHLDQMPPGYLGMRYVALTRGVGMLYLDAPSTRDAGNGAKPPANSRQLLKELLPSHEHPSS